MGRWAQLQRVCQLLRFWQGVPAAIAWRASSGSGRAARGRSTTAAGLPPNSAAVNASTWQAGGRTQGGAVRRADDGGGGGAVPGQGARARGAAVRHCRLLPHGHTGQPGTW